MCEEPFREKVCEGAEKVYVRGAVSSYNGAEEVSGRRLRAGGACRSHPTFSTSRSVCLVPDTSSAPLYDETALVRPFLPRCLIRP